MYAWASKAKPILSKENEDQELLLPCVCCYFLVFIFANVLEKKGFAPEARVSSNHPEGFCSRAELLEVPLIHAYNGLLLYASCQTHFKFTFTLF
ncbi:hypothetical protein P8452_22248 [Trifolium repens]|nr:hypothetical protein P8452_22248 [Trifolium repens]